MMYNRDNPPSWATHAYYFETATTFFDKEQFLWMDENGAIQDSGRWGENDNDTYEEYTSRVERLFKLAPKPLNFSLENE